MAQGAPDPAAQSLLMRNASTVDRVDAGMILAAAKAGERLVAVGPQGVILLSDDQGRSFRQSRSPVQVQLTGVHFVSERTGWAVGHAGVVLRTDDGGESWRVQREDFSVDQPLFSVYFKDAQNGWAVGLWSLMLRTHDGGNTWRRVQLPPPPGSKKADLNLYRIFSDGAAGIFVAAEHGSVLRSIDGGERWSYSATGYQGSFWAGVAWPDGTILVGGLRGSMYRSGDRGGSWTAVPMGQVSSVTSLVRLADGVYGVGSDGLLFSSSDRGVSFTVKRRSDRAPLTVIVPTSAGTMMTFSKFGVPPDALVKPIAAP